MKSEPYTKFKNFNVRYVNNCPPGIVIAKDTVFVSAFEASPVGVVITSMEMAQAFRDYFYKEWNKAEKT